eukprot:909720-Pyramimonas_sp.AAC.1
MGAMSADRTRNEAGAEFARLNKLINAINRRVGDYRNQSERGFFATSARQKPFVTRHVSLAMRTPPP